MSRSIHATRTDFRRARRFTFADAQQRREHLRRIVLGIRKKREIKGMVRTARKTPKWTELPPVPPEVVPIDIVDSGPGIGYAASPSDLVGVMLRLPAGSLNGLSAIRLCLGKEYLEDEMPVQKRAEATRDPWLGRAGSEILPGIFGGSCLGTYWHDPSRIDLYAFVHDPATPLPGRWAIFLRLHLLATFVHEVAHHQDRMQRLASRRWRGDDEQRAETYAEMVESSWIMRYVAPYLEETYPDAVEELLAWVRDHGGATLPLASLAGDYQCGVDGKVTPASFGSAQEPFMALVRDTVTGQDGILARLAFARALMCQGYSPQALDTVQRIVAAQPKHVEALTLEAELHARARDHRVAEALARRAVECDATWGPAWTILADAYENFQDWGRLLEAAGNALRTAGRPNFALLRQRARANLELGHFAEAATDLDLMETDYFARRSAAILRPLLLLRTGRYEEAISLTRSCPPDAGPVMRAIFSGVRFEAARKLGLPDAGSLPSARELEDLRRFSYAAWADRLAAEINR